MPDASQSTTQANNSEASPTPTQVCRITFTIDQDHKLTYVLSDEAEIRDWVVEQLQSANVDRTPARYVILGSLTVETGNETMDQVFRFLPFGHAKRGDTYLIADFSKLGEHLARICQHLSWNCPPAAARHRLG